ncbi:hypothetical protein Tco_0876441 [Tanacetum coccineum]|uniref:Uncharacterized protein n=1 Tax=Tanacetum coccineum TaxID=301880 RepID=A0ABQ5BSC8_9ASTR
MVSFIQELGYSGKCDMLSAIHTDQMRRPWRTFTAIINRCISRKSSGLDWLRPSRAQILWGMYKKKKIDFVALLWEDFMFQADNKDISSARKENMPYPRFTKVIINHFIFKDKTISMRNRKNIHTVCNDTLLGTLKFVSKTQDYQQYGALIPEEMTNQDIKDSKAYKNYLAFATGQATPRKARKFKKIASPSKKLSSVLEEEPAVKPKRAKKPSKKSTTVPTLGVVIGDTPGVSVSKKKAPAKVDRGKGMDLLSVVTLLEVAQLKKVLKKSKQDTHMLHASGSGDGFGFQPKRNSEDDDSNDDDSDDVTNDDDDDVDSDVDGDTKASDSEKTDSDEDENPNLKQNDDEEEWYEVEYVNTPENYEFIDDDEEYEELYKDTKLRLKDAEHEEERKGDAKMTDAGRGDGPMQSSSVSSDFANQFLNLDNALPVDNKVVSMMNVKSQISAMVDAQLSTRLGDSIQEAFRSYTAEFEKKTQADRKRYIDLVEKSVKDIIKDEVRSLPQILPKEVSEFATPVIQAPLLNHLIMSSWLNLLLN